ncbi:ret finger protein-like 4B [Dasypus novemcinctus]|uniref:ret finger protein-like 4B n=1 Tax=Dasypus novemcinctus TaxID=9361 RepID=UPI0003289303|nr:ret finger protein-like 4B [Dasypus novemcinctus]
MAESIQEEAKCPVCLEFFYKPVLLSCGHTFCFNCMKNWFRERRFTNLTCPLCREVNEQPPKEEWRMEGLSILIMQHGPLLEQSLHISDAILRFQEHMTLDAATANPFLVLSDDLRTVHCGKICHNQLEGPERFTHMTSVLGSSCFHSGRHYWEVEVGEGKEWALGVCKESVNRKEKSVLSSELGFWVISMKGNAIYPSSFPQTSLPRIPDLDRVGIFLDVEMGEIKFFDVRNDALIYMQSYLSSLEPLRPFFYLEQPGEGDNGAPLRLCP